MSTFGGDSWVPEAQYRKRRVDVLLSEEIPDDEARRMSNGRFACLVCPQCPVLDTMPMLHVHRRGMRHLAAAEKQLLKKQRHHDVIQKRIALGKMVGPTASSVFERKNASLFTATKECKAKVLGPNFLSENQSPSQAERPMNTSLAAQGSTLERLMTPVMARTSDGTSGPHPRENLVSSDHIEQAFKEERKRRQQELRSFESGWKRDGNGVWYRDENVEFDSDEEPPDIPPKSLTRILYRLAQCMLSESRNGLPHLLKNVYARNISMRFVRKGGVNVQAYIITEIIRAERFAYSHNNHSCILALGLSG
ncbi:hypothetical protein R1flu_022054 [Riccia fluitans]|uniref:Sodium channel modifier 1 n=1 Tax=Riccia fluitans TaxID=41844 RepID=A0ABD1ZR40_9MARC